MDVGVLRLHRVHHGLDHRARLLRARRRCRGTPAACRGRSATGSENPARMRATSSTGDGRTFMPAAFPTSARRQLPSRPRAAVVRDRVERLGQEGAHQDATRLGLRDAAAAQVEQLLGVEFAHGGAVAALHVVGENLEFRLGIDLGVRRQQQRLVHLIAVGLLRDRAPLRSGPGTRRASVRPARSSRSGARCIAGASWPHHRGEVGVLRSRPAIARRSGAPPRRSPPSRACISVRASRAAEVQRETVVGAARGHVGIERGEMERGRSLRSACAHASDVASSRDMDLGDRVVQIGALADRTSRSASAVRRCRVGCMWRGWKATGVRAPCRG